jgi:uncharacterized protein YdaU (DUF1376 family)
MNRYPFDLESFRRDAAGLSSWQELAYRRLLDHYHDSEQRISDDMALVAEQIKCPVAAVTHVIEELFVPTDSGWMLPDVEETIRIHQLKTEVAQQNGKKSKGRPPKKLPESTVTVEDIYAAYPRRAAPDRDKKAIVRVLKGREISAELLFKRVQRFAAQWQDCPPERKQFIPHAATWFNGGYWRAQDEPMTSAADREQKQSAEPDGWDSIMTEMQGHERWRNIFPTWQSLTQTDKAAILARIDLANAQGDSR